MTLGVATFAIAQQTAATTPAAAAVSKAQQTLDKAAEEGKYTFLLFYKQNDQLTKEMAATLNAGLANKTEQAVVASAQVGIPAEQALVTKYDVSRAPMPMTVVIAPNGALTGIFSQRVAVDKLSDAFVTPTMMLTMKSLQAGKLVLVTVQGSAKGFSKRSAFQRSARDDLDAGGRSVGRQVPRTDAA